MASAEALAGAQVTAVRKKYAQAIFHSPVHDLGMEDQCCAPQSVLLDVSGLTSNHAARAALAGGELASFGCSIHVVPVESSNVHARLNECCE